LILTNNLFGTEIDQRAGALAAFALTMKAAAKRKLFLKNPVEPNVCVLDPISFSVDELNYLVIKDGDRHAEEAFWNQFAEADTFGALIRPNSGLAVRLAQHLTTLDDDGDLFRADALIRAQRVIGQATYLTREYAVVVANPPYMGSKQMNALLSQFMKDAFPESKSDLFAGFIERCLALLPRGGYAGMMTPFVWMFNSSYARLRDRLIHRDAIDSLVQLEYSGFDGATVPICAFVLCRGREGSVGAFIRLADFVGPAAQGPSALQIIQQDRAKLRGMASNGMDRHLYRVASADFATVPGSPVAFWLSEKMRAAFATGTPIGHVAAPRKGIDTGENAEFLRMWWEVSRSQLAIDRGPEGKWLPYNKGGGFRRWYGNREVVVNWEFDGAAIRARTGWASRKPTLRNLDFMKREGFSWGTVSSGGFSARYTPPGALFDNGGCTLFADQGLDRLGALLNSTTNDLFLGFLAPTLNFQPGDIALVPLAPGFNTFHVGSSECVNNAREDYDSFEDSWDFTWNPLVRQACDSAKPLD
jgi:hypothetical protein